MQTKPLIVGACLIAAVSAAAVGVSQYGGLSKAQVTKVMEVAKNKLPSSGTLCQKADGFTYINVSDDYIHKLYEFIEGNGIKKPPYFRRPDAPGAHISVFYEAEIRGLDKRIAEIGKNFKFEISNFKTVKSRDKEYFVIQVNSPELQALRASYGLRPFLNGHEFHITIGVRYLR